MYEGDLEQCYANLSNVLPKNTEATSRVSSSMFKNCRYETFFRNKKDSTLLVNYLSPAAKLNIATGHAMQIYNCPRQL